MVNAAKGLLLADLDGDLQFHRLSRTVNSVMNQGIEPICCEPCQQRAVLDPLATFVPRAAYDRFALISAIEVTVATA